MISKITPNRLIGSLVLGSAFIVGSQGISADKKESPKVLNEKGDKSLPKQNITLDKLTLSKEVLQEKLFKQVEILKPGTKERKEVLEILKQKAVFEFESPNRNEIGKKLIQLMEKNKNAESWKDLASTILDIMEKQALENKEILRVDNWTGKVDKIKLNEELMTPFAKCLISAFDDKSPEELKTQAQVQIINLIYPPFIYKEPFKEFHKILFQEISNVPEDKQKEVAVKLRDITGIHFNHMAHLQKHEYTIVWELARTIAPSCETILKTNLKLLASDDLTKKTIATDNLIALNNVFSFSSSRSVLHREMNAVKHMDQFFKGTLTKDPKLLSTQELEVTIKASQALLELCSENPIEYHKSYQSWLQKQIDNILIDTSKEKQILIEDAIAHEANRSYLHPPEIRKEFQPLIEKYTKLTVQNLDNPLFLGKALDTFIIFRDRIVNSSYDIDPKIKNNLSESTINLLDFIIDGINKLPESKEKTLLRSHILSIPAYLSAEEKAKQNKLIEKLSDFYCKQPHNIEEFLQVRGSLLYEDLTSSWSPYMLHSFVSKNLDYFEKNTNQILESHKKAKEPEHKLSTRIQVLELYKFFSRLEESENLDVWLKTRNLKTRYELGSKELQPLILKTSSFFKEKLERPLFKIILSEIDNETVKSKKTKSGQILTDNVTWKALNRELQILVKLRPSLSSEIRETIVKRLKKDSDPHIREMCYETLRATLSREHNIDKDLMSILKDGIAKETSPEAIRGISKVLSEYYILSNKKDGSYFNPFRDLSKVKDIKYEEVSPLFTITLDAIRILGGDGDLFKAYLPHHTFKPEKDGSINKDDLKAILQLRKNAFLTLANTGINISTSAPDYRDSVMNYLERRLERYAPPDDLIKIWGEEATALIKIYSTLDSTTKSNSEIQFNSKLDFLREKFFEGTPTYYEIEGKKNYTSQFHYSTIS